MTPYRFFHSFAAASNATALGTDNAIVRRDGIIVGVDWSIVAAGGTAGWAGRYAICFSASNAFDLSDTSLIIAEAALAVQVGVTTAFQQVNKFCPLNIPVIAGEQLFLSWQLDNGSTTVTQKGSAILWIQDKGAERRIVRS